MPETSVVIRSFNEQETIGDVLDAVEDQRYRDFEIVLVDSGSTDDTLDIAGPRVDTVTHIDPRDFTFGYSLNAGCAASEGDVYAFLSAHAIPTDDRWLGRLVQHLRDDRVAMAYSNQTGVAETTFAEQRHFDELFGEERRYQTAPEYFANNASSAIDADLWERRPFDEYLTGLEDIDWTKYFLDRGYVAVYEPNSCIYHIHDESPSQVYTRFRREAIAAREIGVRSPHERWLEYARVPRDVAGDLLAAYRSDELDLRTAADITSFRVHQRAGAADGLQADRDLQADRYDFFYGGTNERVVVERPGEVTIKDDPRPAVKPNDVLVGVEYVGVSQTDAAIYRGTHPGFADEDAAYPVVPGREYTGTVLDAGANVEDLEAGDAVVGDATVHCGRCRACRQENGADCEDRQLLGVDGGDGAFARYLSLPSEHVHALPSSLDRRPGTLALPLAVALAGVDRVENAVGGVETAALLGAPARGNLAARLLRRRGVEVTAFEQTPAYARRLPSNVPVEGPEPTDLDRFDLVIEAAGDAAALGSAVEAVGSGGAVLGIGSAYGPISLDALGGDVTLVRAGFGEADLDAALDVLPDLDAGSLVDRTVPLADADSALAATAERSVCRAVLSTTSG